MLNRHSFHGFVLCDFCTIFKMKNARDKNGAATSKVSFTFFSAEKYTKSEQNKETETELQASPMRQDDANVTLTNIGLLFMLVIMYDGCCSACSLYKLLERFYSSHNSKAEIIVATWNELDVLTAHFKTNNNGMHNTRTQRKAAFTHE